jgi:hypothetical protein
MWPIAAKCAATRGTKPFPRDKTGTAPALTHVGWDRSGTARGDLGERGAYGVLYTGTAAPLRHRRRPSGQTIFTRQGWRRAPGQFCWKCDRNLRLPGGTLPASQAAIPARPDHTNGLGESLSKPHGYNARSSPDGRTAHSRDHIAVAPNPSHPMADMRCRWTGLIIHGSRPPRRPHPRIGGGLSSRTLPASAASSTSTTELQPE